MSLYAGKLRHRLTLCRLNEAQAAASGELSQSAEPEMGCWAHVEPLSGNELFEARQVIPEITHRVTLRYGVPASPEMVFKWGDRVLGIISVIDVEERHRELTVACKEIV